MGLEYEKVMPIEKSGSWPEQYCVIDGDGGADGKPEVLLMVMVVVLVIMIVLLMAMVAPKANLKCC